ncbi:MAG: AAA family ATPase [Promethearchaeota archaeon]
MKCLIALVGPPASGKSTVAAILRDLVSRVPGISGTGVQVLDRDLTREGLTGYQFCPEAEAEVRDRFYGEVREALSGGGVVIVDDMNYYRSMRHDLVEIAAEFDAPVYFVVLGTPLETCLAWNAARGCRVPEEVVEEVYRKMDPPDRYAWERPALSLRLPISPEDLERILSEFLEKIRKEAPGGVAPGTPIGTSNGNGGRDELHAVDVETRRVVGDAMSGLASIGTSLEGLAGELNDLRRKFIRGLRKREFDPWKATREFEETVRKLVERRVGKANDSDYYRNS